MIEVCEYLSRELSEDFGVNRTFQGVLVKSVEANLERELGPNGVYIYSAMLNQAHLFSQSQSLSCAGKQLTHIGSRWGTKKRQGVTCTLVRCRLDSK